MNLLNIMQRPDAEQRWLLPLCFQVCTAAAPSHAMHLFIRDSEIEIPGLTQFVNRSGAAGTRQVARGVFPPANAVPAADNSELQDRAILDFAFVPDDRRLGDYRLLVRNRDSTAR